MPLVGIFTLRPSSVSPAASHLPPRGKALVRWNLVGAGGNPRGRRGHAPALRTGALLLPKLLSRIEPGDLLGWWSAARVTVLPLTAAARPKTSVHHPVTNRVTPQWCRFTTRVAGSNCQRPLAARRPCLSLWERWHGASRDGEGFSVYHHVTNRVTPSGGGLPPG